MTEKPYWEIVVLTSKDRQQQEIYKNQIAAKKLRNAILSSIKFEVYADPEEFPIGTGGSSIHCLNRLFEKYGENIFSKRILVVHAGGFSKRLPNHSIFGKIFSPVSVHGHNIRDLLDLKIEFTQRFCPFMVNGGVFFAASDDVETFTLEGLKVKDFRNFEGVVALAHPSSLEIGKNHGVYVLSLPTPGSSLAWFDDDCTEVLQKPSVSAMRSHGCTFTNNGAECVYSDSCFWITPSVAHKLLELERHFDIYKKETCIYGNFLTCLGRNKNIIKVGDSLQQAICEALKETPLRVLVLKNSNFYHLGTIKEYLDNLTKNRDMRETYNFIVQSTGFLKDVSVMCSHIKPDCYLSASVVEFSVIQMPVRGERIILSNVQLIGREAIDLPSGWLFHTIPINVQASVKYVTIAMHENDNPKQKCSNSRIVFGEVFIETLTSFDGVELWNLPLFKACETMTDSFLWTLDFIKTVSAQPENLSLYFSMAECMKRCSIQKMKHFRSLMS